MGLAPDVWFTGTRSVDFPIERPQSGHGHGPPNERTLKLGKSAVACPSGIRVLLIKWFIAIRVLQAKLPSLLTTPLPQDILSPHITLQLFPSTHPHLPTVKGRIAYTAALWTSPVAWGRMPVLGNVKLIVMSERMVKHGGGCRAGEGTEKLIVRWRTCPKAKSNGSVSIDKLAELLSTSSKAETEAMKEFHGLFLFEFDEEGRILKHVIEHAEEGNQWARGTAKVISVTDWLLGRAWKREEDLGLALGACRVRK